MPSIQIDENLCVGTADCIRIAPDAFVIEDGDDVVSVTPGATEVPIALLRKAAYDCPTGAITVEE
jgi:ferredoxin